MAARSSATATQKGCLGTQSFEGTGLVEPTTGYRWRSSTKSVGGHGDASEQIDQEHQPRAHGPGDDGGADLL